MGDNFRMTPDGLEYKDDFVAANTSGPEDQVYYGRIGAGKNFMDIYPATYGVSVYPF